MISHDAAFHGFGFLFVDTSYHKDENPPYFVTTPFGYVWIFLSWSIPRICGSNDVETKCLWISSCRWVCYLPTRLMAGNEKSPFWIREKHLQMVGIFHWLGVSRLSNTDFSCTPVHAWSKDWIARPWLSLWCKTGGLQEFLLQLAVVSWLDFLCVQKPLHEWFMFYVCWAWFC